MTTACSTGSMSSTQASTSAWRDIADRWCYSLLIKRPCREGSLFLCAAALLGVASMTCHTNAADVLASP